MRASRDWVDNRWVDVKQKPDVVSFICSSLRPNPKLPTISTVDESSKHGDSASVDRNVLANSNPKAVEEKTKEVSDSSAAENVDKMSQNLKK